MRKANESFRPFNLFFTTILLFQTITGFSQDSLKLYSFDQDSIMELLYRSPLKAYDTLDFLLAETKLRNADIVRIWNLKGGAAWLSGRLDLSIKDYLHAAFLCDSLGFTEEKYRIDGNLGNVFNDLKAYGLAKQYYRKGIGTITHANSLLNMATLFLAEENSDSCQFYLNWAFKEYQKQETIEGLALCASNQAKLDLLNNKMEKATLQLERSDSLFRISGNAKMIQINRLVREEIKLVKGGHLDIHHVNQILNKAKEAGYLDINRDAHQLLFEHYKEKRPALALWHLQERLALDETITGSRERTSSSLIEGFFDNQIRLKNIELEQQQTRSQRLAAQERVSRQRLYFSFFLFTVLSLGIFLINLYKTKARRLQSKVLATENKHLEEQILHEQKLSEEQARLLHLREKELLSFSLKEAQWKESLKEVKESLQKEQTPNHIIKKLNDANRKWDNWDHFDRHFKSIHKDFYQSLSEKHQLSRKELRMSALSVLGLNAKEISEILAIKPSSVDIARHRLKKKMGLSPDLSLDQYLRKHL